MFKLRIFIFNNNLLRFLFVDVFVGVLFFKFSLYNNYFMYFLVVGVLDQLIFIIQIDLYGNFWECFCIIVFFKQWVECLGFEVLMSDFKCEMLVNFFRKDFMFFFNDEICFQLYVRILFMLILYSKNSIGLVEIGMYFNFYLDISRVFIFVLVLGLLLVFVIFVFIVVGMFVFILRNRKRFKRRDVNFLVFEINFLQIVCDFFYWYNGFYNVDGVYRVYDCGFYLFLD